LVLDALADPAVAGDCDLVAFGGGPFDESEKAALRERNLSGRVFQADGDDRRLAGWYRQAVALVYPSQYEGFGLPPVEAMSVGCPVIVSDRSSLPEVVGDAGLYIPPDDVGRLRAALAEVRRPDIRTGLIERGRARGRAFSWARCARETWDFDEETAARPARETAPSGSVGDTR
jgi:glycosyltransferase involved in cell wall biosynthesis